MKMINFIEKMNSRKDRQEKASYKEAHILTIMACALAFAEITQQINAVMRVLKSESVSSGVSYFSIINSTLSDDDKKLLISLCKKHGKNLETFAEALDSQPENEASNKMNSFINDLVAGFPGTDFSIVDRYIKSILETLRED